MSLAPTFQATLLRDVRVPMHDGVELRADIWRPARDGRYPVLLQRTPYDRTVTTPSIEHAGLDPVTAAERGYVVVIQDVRGRWASGGTFTPFTNEAQDGADTIRWCAELPFGDGQVGMYGASYVGATQMLAATQRPAALRAIAPAITASEYYEGWTYQGGALQLFAVFWTLFGLLPSTLATLPEHERAEGMERLLGLLADPASMFARLPIGDLDGLEQHAPYLRDWLDHDRRDDYWRSLAPNERYEVIEVPGLHIGGWHDIFVAGTIENAVRLREEAPTESARARQHLLIGPWSHALYGDVVGEVEYGPTAALPAAALTELQLAWFDEHLRGAEPAERPAARYFLMAANTWHDASAWPPATEERKLYLHSDGRANTLAGDGRLTPEPCRDGEAADTFVYDPADPAPTRGGATLLPGQMVSRWAGSHDQREVESREDVLVYTSEPLTEPLDVTGAVRATVACATSAPDTDLTAKLVDVHPAGNAMLVCDGILVLSSREGLDRRIPVVPGEPLTVTVELGHTAMRFSPGHRIRLELSSSNFPRFARNPNTGARAADARPGTLAVARQRVFHDSARPSYLSLPVGR